MHKNLLNTVKRQKALTGMGTSYIVASMRDTENVDTGGYEFLSEMKPYPCTVSGEVDGLIIEVTVESDNDNQLGEEDYVTGKFSATQEEGAIKNTTTMDYMWYVPSDYAREHYVAEVKAKGVSRGRVAETVRQWIERDMRADAEREYVGIIATVSSKGVKLSESSLWSVDIGSSMNTKYIVDVARECIEEALGEVKWHGRGAADGMTENGPLGTWRGQPIGIIGTWNNRALPTARTGDTA